MNCKNFRKFVGAFADGELDVQLNLEALEHLNMCPACAKRVNEITDCKAALQRVWPRCEAPAYLRTCVANMLTKAVQSGDLSNDHEQAASKTTATASTKTLRFSYFVKPAAIAAAILLCVAVWQLAPDEKVAPGEITVLAARTVADVRTQHMHCSAMPSGMHHDQTLSRSLSTIASRLSKRLKLKVLVPDLTSFGYKLVGADACGIQGRAAAHVLYESAGGERKLSVYTVNRLSDLTPNRPVSPSGRRYFVASVDNALTVLAWHEGLQSYTVCAPLPEESLLAFFDHVKVTAGKPVPLKLDQLSTSVLATR